MIGTQPEKQMERIARSTLLGWYYPGTWAPTRKVRRSLPKTKDGKRRGDKHAGVSKCARSYRARVMGFDLGPGV